MLASTPCYQICLKASLDPCLTPPDEAHHPNRYLQRSSLDQVLRFASSHEGQQDSSMSGYLEKTVVRDEMQPPTK